MLRVMLLVTVCSGLAVPPDLYGADPIDFFERSVRPLLVKRCGDCHSAEEPEGELILTTPAGIAAGGSLGAIVEPGAVDRSRLIQSVRYTSRLKMPPDGRLAEQEVEILEQWVRDGAKLPGHVVPRRAADPASEWKLTAADRGWWAFQPLNPSRPPEVRAEDRVRTPVDRFILHKLEHQALTLSAEADRRTLIRRVTFDLTGLPPAPEQVAAFVSDTRPDAYERLVERLLASPHYGIRWGRHWLDLARYSDTNGGGFDYVYPQAWRYRDYVVDAWNADLGFDQFLVEQLAGDLLPADCSESEYVRRLTATGFLTLAPKGLGMQDKEQMRMDVVDDQIDVLGRSLLGVTLACARCHDHKFDPISTADYYALAGVFRSTRVLSDTDKNPSYWPEFPLELPSVTVARADYVARKQAKAKQIDSVHKTAQKALVERARQRTADYLLAAVRIHRSEPRSEAVAHWPLDGSDSAKIAATAGPVGQLVSLAETAGPIPQRIPGKLGRALRFEGRQDVVSFARDDLQFVELGKTTDFSVAFWLRAAAGYVPQTADTLIAARYGSAMWFLALRPGGYHGIYVRHYDGSRVVDVKPKSDQLATLTDQGWHHVVFCSDRDRLGRVYIDGQLAGEQSIATVSSRAAYTGATAFQIGPATNQFRGDLDDVAMWHRALSASEVKELFEAGSVARDPDAAVTAGENAAEVQQRWKRMSSPSESWTIERAAKSGLVAAIVQRFVDQVAAAEGDPKSPLHSLLATKNATRADIEVWLEAQGDALQKVLDDPQDGPFVVGTAAQTEYDSESRSRLEQLQREAAAIEAERVPDPVLGMVARDESQPADLRVHIAGDHRRPGAVLPRGIPEVLVLPAAAGNQVDGQTPEQGGVVAAAAGQPTGRDGQLPIQAQQSGRLELARWLTDARHPLTARVFVNRLWMWHFGTGLVATPDNFGRLGELPSHPELLDWLALRLVRGGWSIKSLHREIVLSASYRQQSQVESGHPGNQLDAGNRWLWRMNRRRLEAEALRDAILAVSGRLDDRMKGTVNDWKSKMFSVDNENAETANYDTDRRSLYLPVVRGAALHEMLQLFDFGDPNSLTSNRSVTTVAPQALFLMNSPFVTEQSAALSGRLLREAGNGTTDRIQLAYQLSLGRSCTEAECVRAEQFLADADEAQWQLFCQMLFCLNEFAYIP